MSFEDLNKFELRKVADEFSLEVAEDENATEDELLAEVSKLSVAEVTLSFPDLKEKLEEDDEEGGDDEVISSEDTPPKGTAKKAAAKKTPARKAAAKRTESEEAAPKKSKTVVPEDYSLIKMTRNNPVYEVRGYRFERDRAPFCLVKNEDVDYLIEVEGGFAMAKPSEIEKFYN